MDRDSVDEKVKMALIKFYPGIKMMLDVLPYPPPKDKRIRLKELIGFVDDALPDQLKKMTHEIRASYEHRLQVIVVVPVDTDLKVIENLRMKVVESVASSIEKRLKEV